MRNLTAEEIVKQLDMSTHPEGGFFKETYRALGTIGENSLPDNMVGYRRYATSIHYLLRSKDFSAFHRIKSDEIWHFHAGDTLEIYEIDEDGKLIVTALGSNIQAGEALTYVVSANRWFAARPKKDGGDVGYCLVSCNVAPGFDPQDFEMANHMILRDEIERYPELSDLTLKTSTTSYFPSSVELGS